MNKTIIAQVFDDKGMFMFHKEGEGLEFCDQLTLPEIKIKCGKYTFKFTDMQYLMVDAINNWNSIVDVVAENETNTVQMLVKNDASNQMLDAMIRIFMAMRIEYKKRGTFMVHNIFTKIDLENDEPYNSITFHLNALIADHIAEYVRETNNTNYYDLMMHLACKSIEDDELTKEALTK